MLFGIQYCKRFEVEGQIQEHGSDSSLYTIFFKIPQPLLLGKQFKKTYRRSKVGVSQSE